MPVFRTITIGGVERLILEARSERVFNPNAFEIPAGHALCYVTDGVALADPTDDGRVTMAGITTAPIPSHTYGWIVKTGPAVGVLAGSGLDVGDEVFLSEVAGEMTGVAPEAFTSSIVRLGYAIPNTTNGQPTDLNVDIEVLTRP